MPALLAVGLEGDGVEVRGRLAETMRIGVGQHVGPVMGMDHADLVARVARQTRMAMGMQIRRADGITDPEARLRLDDSR